MKPPDAVFTGYQVPKFFAPTDACLYRLKLLLLKYEWMNAFYAQQTDTNRYNSMIYVYSYILLLRWREPIAQQK